MNLFLSILIVVCIYLMVVLILVKWNNEEN